jgi:hypothetical protein
MNNKTQKRNHYIPRFFLQNFCDDSNQIYTYDKLNKKSWFEKPSNAAIEKNLYCHNDNDIIEQILSNKIESPAKCVLDNLVNHKTFPKSHEGREQLALFFATLGLRSPAYIDHLNESLKINHDFTLQYMLLLAIDIFVPLFYHKSWALMQAPEDCHFVLSDNSYNLYNPDSQFCIKNYQKISEMQGDMVFFPISNQLTLAMITNKECADQLFMCDVACVEGLNRMALRRSKRFLFASNKKSLFMQSHESE